MIGQIVNTLEYGVFLDIDIIDVNTGDIVGSHSEQEFFSTFSSAEKAAADYRSEVGETFCSWGDRIGILKSVSISEEPCVNQYVV